MGVLQRPGALYVGMTLADNVYSSSLLLASMNPARPESELRSRCVYFRHCETAKAVQNMHETPASCW